MFYQYYKDNGAETQKSSHILCSQRPCFRVIQQYLTVYYTIARQLDITPTPQMPQIDECQLSMKTFSPKYEHQARYKQLNLLTLFNSSAVRTRYGLEPIQSCNNIPHFEGARGIPNISALSFRRSR